MHGGLVKKRWSHWISVEPTKWFSVYRREAPSRFPRFPVPWFPGSDWQRSQNASTPPCRTLRSGARCCQQLWVGAPRLPLLYAYPRISRSRLLLLLPLLPPPSPPPPSSLLLLLELLLEQSWWPDSGAVSQGFQFCLGKFGQSRGGAPCLIASVIFFLHHRGRDVSPSSPSPPLQGSSDVNKQRMYNSDVSSFMRLSLNPPTLGRQTVHVSCWTPGTNQLIGVDIGKVLQADYLVSMDLYMGCLDTDIFPSVCYKPRSHRREMIPRMVVFDSPASSSNACLYLSALLKRVRPAAPSLADARLFGRCEKKHRFSVVSSSTELRTMLRWLPPAGTRSFEQQQKDD